GNAAEIARDKPIAYGECVASKNAVLGRRLPVAAEIVTVRVIQQTRVAGEIVGLSRGIGGLREQVHQLARHRVDARSVNGVIREGLAGSEIVNRRIGDAGSAGSGGRKYTGAFVGQRHGGDARDSAADPGAFVIEKAEQLVFLDGAAEIAAELVLHV